MSEREQYKDHGRSFRQPFSDADRDAKRKSPPSADTHAEFYYYKKQIDARTMMIIVLQDGEEIEGTIEWYDRDALKINRPDTPNLLLLKHNIKYMYKAEEKQG